MSQQLHPTMESFYLSILKYAGLQYKDGVISNISDKIGKISVDGKPLTLPYFDNLRNPEGRHVFHPLNESFNSPETVFLSLYKRRLTLELNIKLSNLIVSLLTVCADVHLQQKAKSSKLVQLLSSIGETDMNTIENFIAMAKYSQKTNEEAYIVDFFLKKNGEVNDTPYSAIGKVNFVMHKELNRALEDKGDYKVFGCKVRKKDILAVTSVLDALFSLNEIKEEAYVVGTDHKPFRYFNALLLASYQVADRINEVATLLEELKEPALATESLYSDLEWSKVLEQLYDLTDVIRTIPNQSNPQVEAHKLKVNEPKQRAQVPQVPVPDISAQYQAPPAPPAFNPQQASQLPQQQPQAYQQQAPQQAPSAEDIIRGAVAQQQYMYQQAPLAMGMMQPMGVPVMQQPMMQPAMMMQPQMQMQPTMAPQQQMVHPAMMQPQMQMQQPMMQPMGMQPGMMMQQMQPPMQMQHQQQQGGIPILPFMN